MSEQSNDGVLSTITKGKRKRPIFALLYGLDGVGKTTMVSHAPEPVYIGTETGTDQLDVARFPQPETYADFLRQLAALYSPKDYHTVVLDSVDWLEPIIWRQICAESNITSIEDYGGGFSKGYIRAAEFWRDVLIRLTYLAQRYHVILIGHATVKTFNDPDQAAGYDRYQLSVNEKAARLIREAVDVVLFATFKTTLVRDKATKKARGLSDGSRVMYTERRPAFDAKNRFDLPFEMPLAWKPLGQAIQNFYEPVPTTTAPAELTAKSN